MLTVTSGSCEPWRLAIGDPQADALGDRGGALEPAARHHHRELVAAVAGTDVEDADGTPQDVGHVLDDRVAGQMPKAIVHRLERVHVDDLERQRGALPRCALQFFLQAALKVETVEEAARWIDDGGLRQAFDVTLGTQPCQRQRRRSHQRPEPRDVVGDERHVALAIGQTQDAEHVCASGHRYDDARLGAEPRAHSARRRGTRPRRARAGDGRDGTPRRSARARVRSARARSAPPRSRVPPRQRACRQARAARRWRIGRGLPRRQSAPAPRTPRRRPRPWRAGASATRRCRRAGPRGAPARRRARPRSPGAPTRRASSLLRAPAARRAGRRRPVTAPACARVLPAPTARRAPRSAHPRLVRTWARARCARRACWTLPSTLQAPATHRRENRRRPQAPPTRARSPAQPCASSARATARAATTTARPPDGGADPRRAGAWSPIPRRRAQKSKVVI